MKLPTLNLDSIEASSEPSCTFTLNGRTFRVRSRDDVHYAAVKSWLEAQANEDTLGVSVQMGDFYRAVLFPEDVEDFFLAMADPAAGFTVKRSGALVRHLTAELFGMKASADPTERPTTSPSGSRRTSTASKANSGSRATRRRTAS